MYKEVFLRVQRNILKGFKEVYLRGTKNEFIISKQIIVKPKQAGTCGRGIRNERTSKSLICSYTNIKCYGTNSIYSLLRLYAILLSIIKKTARIWKFGIADDMLQAPPTSASLFWFYYI